MRRSLVLISALVVVVGTFVPVDTQAAERKMLFEDFTNVQCPPCADHDPWFRAFMDAHRDQVTLIAWHMSWPGYDPFHVSNTVENNARRWDYNVNAVPTIFFDGVEPPSYPYTPAVLENAFNNRMAIPAPLSISFDGWWNEFLAIGHVDVTLTVEDAMPGANNRLVVALVESGVPWNGIAGYDMHDGAMRDVLTPVGGENVGSFVGGEVVTYGYDFAVDDAWLPAPDILRMEIVAFVEDAIPDEDPPIFRPMFNSNWIDVETLEHVVVGVPGADVAFRPGIGPNHPNPFNPMTFIPVTTEAAGTAEVKIYGPDGSLVRTLLRGFLPAGTSQLQWDGLGDQGQALASGTYFVRLEAGATTDARRITLLK
jgi:hypothetical protein